MSAKKVKKELTDQIPSSSIGDINYMKLRVPFSTIFLATGLLPSQAMRQSEPLFNAQSSEDSLARSKGRDEPPSADSTYKSGGNWLFNESEYFPFDADSFEER